MLHMAGLAVPDHCIYIDVQVNWGHCIYTVGDIVTYVTMLALISPYR